MTYCGLFSAHGRGDALRYKVRDTVGADDGPCISYRGVRPCHG